MIIKRIQVEEGFLDGLDLEFSAGLNVLFGPRGAGKTSVIELIRYCVGAAASSDAVSRAAKQHALSILGSGSVAVTLSNGEDEFVLRRTADSWTSTGPDKFQRPIVLSQNEIETVGLHASARLQLIDTIRGESGHQTEEKESAILSLLRSQTSERASLAREIQEIRDQLATLKKELDDADSVRKEHASALAGIKKATKESSRLTALSTRLAELGVRAGAFSRLRSSLDQRLKRMNALSDAFGADPWPDAAGCPDPLTEVRAAIRRSEIALKSAVSELGAAVHELSDLERENVTQSTVLDEEARALRRQLEALQMGAGEIARKLAAIQDKASQQSALTDLAKNLSLRLARLQAERKIQLDQLESIRSARFEERKKLVAHLNKEFAPTIRISIERAGQNAEYASAIVASLRGSGLRFNEVAPLIADEVSPREFVEIVENEKADELAKLIGVTPSRAARIIDRVRDEGVEAILTAEVEDGIGFSLLDGGEYKATEAMSMGQRCTVVLPLLLKQAHAAVVVDQPEDHLDNAFIVQTLIQALRKRGTTGQLIFSTHNANIPVLGEAQRVTLLGSDGGRGFVRHTGPLDSPESVASITSVMEGGLKAFERRASFYRQNFDE